MIYVLQGLVDQTKRVLRGYFDLLMVVKEMGDIFCNIGVHEPQKTASEAFCQFGEYHRQMEKYGIKMLKATKPVSEDVCVAYLSHQLMTKFHADTTRLGNIPQQGHPRHQTDDKKIRGREI